MFREAAAAKDEGSGRGQPADREQVSQLRPALVNRPAVAAWVHRELQVMHCMHVADRVCMESDIPIPY